MDSRDPEHLLSHVRWVQALARELAGGAGDDVAQDTFVAALRRPDDGRNLAAWLAGVVRNLARRARRTDARRAERESGREGPGATSLPDEIVAEGELQRRLVAAVMELDDPYRATVLLHYFRALPLVEIARIQGVPAATVRTRLRRALAALRAELDRGTGGRSGWAVVAAALGTGAPGPALVGGIGMGVKLALGAGLAIVLLGAVAWQAGHRRPSENRLGRGASGTAPREVAVTGSLARTEVPTSTTAPASRTVADAPPTFAEVLVHGDAHDREGRPVEAWVRVEDRLGAGIGTEQATPGSWALAGLHPGRWSLRAGARGHVGLARELVVSGTSAEQRLDLVFDLAGEIRVRVLDEEGRALTPRDEPLLVLVTPDPPVAGRLGLRANPNELLQAASLASWSPEPSASEVPEGCFALVRLQVGFPLSLSLVSRHDVLETQRLEEPVEEVVFNVDHDVLAARLGGVTVRFVDGLTRAPLAGVRGFLTGEEVHLSQTSRGPVSGADGACVVAGKAPGVWLLHGLLDGHADATRCVRVEPGRVVALDEVPLWPTAVIRGRVLDEQGRERRALFRWIPRAEMRTPLDVDATFHERGGRFELAGVPRTDLWLLVQAGDLARRTLAVDASPGSVEDLEIRMREGTRVALHPGPGDLGRQVSVVGADGAPYGTWTLGDRTLGVPLEPGAYELWLGSAERVEERVPFTVGGEPLELALPPGGR